MCGGGRGCGRPRGRRSRGGVAADARGVIPEPLGGVCPPLPAALGALRSMAALSAVWGAGQQCRQDPAHGWLGVWCVSVPHAQQQHQRPTAPAPVCQPAREMLSAAARGCEAGLVAAACRHTGKQRDGRGASMCEPIPAGVWSGLRLNARARGMLAGRSVPKGRVPAGGAVTWCCSVWTQDAGLPRMSDCRACRTAAVGLPRSDCRGRTAAVGLPRMSTAAGARARATLLCMPAPPTCPNIFPSTQPPAAARTSQGGQLQVAPWHAPARACRHHEGAPAFGWRTLITLARRHAALPPLRYAARDTTCSRVRAAPQ